MNKSQDQRNYGIAKQFYNGEKSEAQLAETYGLSKARIQQIYDKFVKRAECFRQLQLKHPETTNSLSQQYELLTERFVEITAEQAFYNVRKYSRSFSKKRYAWTPVYSKEETGDLIVLMSWKSIVHHVTMIRKVEYPDGMICWQANAHFLENEYASNTPILKKQTIHTQLSDETQLVKPIGDAVLENSSSVLVIHDEKVIGSARLLYCYVGAAPCLLNLEIFNSFGIYPDPCIVTYFYFTPSDGCFESFSSNSRDITEALEEKAAVFKNLRIVDETLFLFGVLPDQFTNVEGYGGILTEFQ